MFCKEHTDSSEPSLEMRMTILIRFGDDVVAQSYREAIHALDPTLVIRTAAGSGEEGIGRFDLQLVDARARTLYQVEELVEGVGQIYNYVVRESRPAS